MKIITYLSNKDDLDKLSTLNIDGVALSMLNNEPLLQIDSKVLKELNTSLKDKGIKVELIETNLCWDDFYNNNLTKKVLSELKDLIKYVEIFKCKYFLINLPFIQDVIKDYDEIEKAFIPFVDLALKQNKVFLLKPNEKQKPNHINYLFKKFKTNTLGLVFDPVLILLNDESVTTTFRTYKNDIHLFFANDATLDGQPALIGEGNAKTKDLLIFLKRIKYKNLILVNPTFQELIKRSENKGFFAKVFHKKQKRKVEQLKATLSVDETKNVTNDDILANQIDEVIKIMR